MPKVSRETATQVDDFGVAIDRHSDLDGYTVNFVSIVETHDLAPMLKSLPGGRCPCPHWGYVIKGRLVVRYEDREETIEAGDAFYVPPGRRRPRRAQRSCSSARPRSWRRWWRL
jgi:glyoxylate utilization-related uncharacterized protein